MERKREGKIKANLRASVVGYDVWLQANANRLYCQTKDNITTVTKINIYVYYYME